MVGIVGLEGRHAKNDGHPHVHTRTYPHSQPYHAFIPSQLAHIHTSQHPHNSTSNHPCIPTIPHPHMHTCHSVHTLPYATHPQPHLAIHTFLLLNQHQHKQGTSACPKHASPKHSSQKACTSNHATRKHRNQKPCTPEAGPSTRYQKIISDI